MINLEEHIVEIEGVKYVTLEVAQAAVAETYNIDKLDDAMNMIEKAVKEMNESVNEALKDD
tara:strand:+ start:146 stop:328 length:183 start_codon:yes stop_codon:yes gene_type:complete